VCGCVGVCGCGLLQASSADTHDMGATHPYVVVSCNEI